MGKREKILVRLLEQSGPKLHTLLLRLTLSEHTAEDLMQELFCRLCNVKDLSKIKNLDAYARQVAIHLACDWLRDRKRNPLSLSETEVESVSPPVAFGPQAREQIEQILEAAARLEGQTWDCFVMRYVEQMEYEAIAARLDKTPHQVRGLCSRAVGKIRDIVNRKRTGTSFKEAANG